MARLIPLVIALASLGLFVGFPSGTLFGWTGLSTATVAAVYPWLCAVGLAVAAKLSLKEGRLFHPEPDREPARASPLLLALAVAALSAAALDGMGRPLGWDELRAALQIPAEPLSRILSLDPRHSDFYPSVNHSVANLASWISVAALGPSIEAFQIPGVVFTILTVATLFWLGRRRLSGFALLLVVGHLLGNLTARWHFVSLRGYPSLMAFSWLAFALGWEAFEAGRELGGKLRVALVASLGLLVWSHTFGILVAGAITAAVFVRCGKRLWPVLLLVPLASLILLREFYVHMRFLFVEGFTRDRFLEAMHAFGWGHFRWAKCGLALALLVAWSRSSREKATYPWLFALLSAGLFVTAMIGVQSFFIRGRYLLGFVGPAVAFLGEAIARDPVRWRRLAAGAAAVILFVVGPAATMTPTALIEQTLADPARSGFFQKAWVRSGFANPECFEVTGDPASREAAKDLFRPRQWLARSDALCPRRFRFVLGARPRDRYLYELRASSSLRVSLRSSRGS